LRTREDAHSATVRLLRGTRPQTLQATPGPRSNLGSRLDRISEAPDNNKRAGTSGYKQTTGGVAAAIHPGSRRFSEVPPEASAAFTTLG
jgi:hypothetical protein